MDNLRLKTEISMVLKYIQMVIHTNGLEIHSPAASHGVVELSPYKPTRIYQKPSLFKHVADKNSALKFPGVAKNFCVIIVHLYA